MKPSRSQDKPSSPSSRSEDKPAQAADAGVAVTPEERVRLLVDLEAEFEAAERSIEEEGTISAEDLLKQRAAYWGGSTRGLSEREEKARRRRRR